MLPWLEAIGVILVTLCAALVARLLSRLRPPYWLVGYVPPMLILCLVGGGRWIRGLEFTVPFSWLLAGRREWVVLAVFCTMVLVVTLCRLRRKREKVFVAAFCAICVVRFGLLPFLLPALIKNYLAALETRLDRDGICLQSNTYTCGPAAAVTALRRLGFDAEESEIAILAHTAPFAGTPPDSLCIALRNLYAGKDLLCEYRLFESVQDLREVPLTIAQVKYSFLVDHYVVVLEVSDDTVVVADPLVGKQRLSHDQFRQKWRFCGIVLKRKR